MLLVIDTNVLISGLLWRGPPHALLDKARDGTVDLVLSPALLKESAKKPSGASLRLLRLVDVKGIGALLEA